MLKARNLILILEKLIRELMIHYIIIKLYNILYKGSKERAHESLRPVLRCEVY